MTPYSANPFSYIFSVVAIGAVTVYFAYGAIDHAGVKVSTTEATVTGKQFTPSGKSYYTTISGGRSWVQSQETPETYAVVLSVADEPMAAVVAKELFESLQVNEKVQVKIRRTRITGRLEVIDVTR